MSLGKVSALYHRAKELPQHVNLLRLEFTQN